MTAMQGTELLIARHGEARCDRRRIVGGPNGCSGLTDRGRQQVERLAQRLGRPEQRPIHAVYTSPLRRAHESAAVIGAYLGLDPDIAPDLAEQHHGTADGQRWTEVTAGYGDLGSLDPDQPLAPGGESWRTFLHRARSALDAITAHHEGRRVLVVGHIDTVEATFHYFFRLSPATRLVVAIGVCPAALTVWRQLPPFAWSPPVRGLRWTLTAHNDAGHLS